MSYVPAVAPDMVLKETRARAGHGFEATTYDRLRRPVIQESTVGLNGAVSRVVTDYDSFGRVWAVSLPFFSSEDPIKYWFEYDSLDRLIREQRFDESGAPFFVTHDRDKLVTTTTDGRGLPAVTEDARGRIEKRRELGPRPIETRFLYGFFGLLQDVVDHHGNVVHLDYDPTRA